MKKFLMMIMVLGLSNMAFAKENMSPEAQEVNSACSADAATAGCGSEKVGTGLLKCLRAYKKSNKTFKFSDSCKAAMKKNKVAKKQKS